jgi:hypothetical protein
MKFAVLALCLGVVLGWGPFTHYDIGCQALFSDSQQVVSCLQNYPSSVKAMELPDSFFFDFDFLATSECPISLKSLHDPVFAGYAVQQAISQNNQANLNYSLSFGSHVISDFAGFSTYYLSPVANVRWLPTWQFMLALV